MIRLCFFFIIYIPATQSALRMDVNDIISMNNINHNLIPTPDCKIQTRSEPMTTKEFVLEDKCNLFWFTNLVIDQECKTKPHSQIHISNKSIFTDFTISSSLCERIIPIEATTGKDNNTIVNSGKNYVVQFYAGEGPPQLDNFSCLTEELNVNFIGLKYYLLTDKKTQKEADDMLNISQSACLIKGWIRPLDIEWK